MLYKCPIFVLTEGAVGA